MLTQIELENFKCFKKRTSFPLGKLTLLTGINGAGKSTLLQSLLLMRQSIEHNDSTAQIILNGSCVNLSKFNDISNTNSSKENVIFLYHYHKIVESYQVNGFIEYCLTKDKEDDNIAQINRINFYCSRNFLPDSLIDIDDFELELNVNYDKLNSPNTFSFNHIQSTSKKKLELYGSSEIINLIPTKHNWMDRHFSDETEEHEYAEHIAEIFDENRVETLDTIRDFPLNFAHIHYISADRLSPQEFYLKSTFNKFPNVGARGEFTVNLLYKKKDELVNDKLCLGEDAKTLYTQTEEWMNVIFNGAKVEIPSSDSNILELLLNTSKSKDRFKPANVGFGYHCVLPIVVSGLIAKEGEKLIVENPEAHLHPRAQSQLAKFLAKVSSCGVQVFIESHSDHILNALRIAVLDEIITSDDLSVLYFQSDPQQPVVKIPVQPNGAIEEWPEGFFDQMEKDFSRLFGI